jgi:hypothetical protein
LSKCGSIKIEALDGNAIQGRVVEDHDSIRIQGESFKGEKRVVRLHHHIARLVLVWKDADVGGETEA